MSLTALSTAQQVIERSIFEKIRLELVDKGYLPNITSYTNDAAGQIAYNSAIDTIVQTKGFAIELFSTGTNKAKQVKKVPRIVMKSGSFLPGALGGSPSRIYEDQGTSYKALVTPPQTVDYYINFHLVSENIEQERVLAAILALSIQRRGYITRIDDATKSFFAKYLNYYDGDNVDEGITEKIYAYEIPDCWDTEDIVVEATVAKLAEITLETNVQKYYDGTWGSDAGDMIITTP